MRGFALSLAALGAAAAASAKKISIEEGNPYGGDDAPQLRFPGDFTRDIVPKWGHSHNDYWRDVPLYTAISNGVLSVEADVWLLDGTLYVGHSASALTDDRTFSGLYVEQLVKILDEANPKNRFTEGLGNGKWNGVYDASSGTSLQLLVDIKTDGPETWPFVVKALEPLRSNGYLTAWNGTHTVPGPVTVIGTGNTPIEQVAPLQNRDYFYDVPTHILNDTITIDGQQYSYNSSISPLTSDSFSELIGWDGLSPANETVLASLEEYSAAAHARGIKMRWWDTPGWPVYAREAVWKALIQAKVDWINADDLGALAEF